MQITYKTSNIWIIGGGKFGMQAANMMSRQHPSNKIVVVEKNIRTCRQLGKHAFSIVCADGIRYLEKNLKNADYPDWIIPAIPIHVAFEWIQAKLSEKYDLHPLDVSSQLMNMLPNPVVGDIGQVYISNADFICPENCPEPDEICTYTDKPRPRILSTYMSDIRFKDFQTVVICSQQLAPGIGGYQPKALFATLDKIKSLQKPVLLSTACRCHGVMHAFKIKKKDNNMG